MVSKLSGSAIKDRLYAKSVNVTLNFYEKYVLPKGLKESLKDIKLKEFRERKKLLNPYQRDQLI